MEYLGLIVVVVAIIGGLVGSGIGGDISSRIGQAICEAVGGGDCSGSDGDGDQPVAGDDSDAAPPGGSTGGGEQSASDDPAEKTPEEIEYEQAIKELDGAEGEFDEEKKKAVEAAKKLGKILADELGITDAVDCFTKGDAGACGETALNVVLSLVGSVPVKVLKKYGWPTEWAKGKKVVQNIIKHGGDIAGGTKGMWKAKKKIDRLKSKVDDLKKKLPKREKKPDGGKEKPGDEGKRKKPVACKTGRNHSFLPGTPVLLADGSRRAIEDVRLGDRVVVTDPKRDLTKTRPVTATITTEDDKHFTALTVKGGGVLATLTATDTHPFWVADQKRWIDAGDIRPGMPLRTSEGKELQVAGVRHYEKRQRTHDLTVQGIHTYYVSAGSLSVLVHNCEVEYGDTPLSKAVQDERLKLKKKGNNFAAATYTDKNGKVQTIVRYSSKGRENHAEDKLLREIEKEGGKLTEIYSELQPCQNRCSGNLAKLKGVKVSWSWPWTTSAEGDASRKVKDAAVSALFGRGKSGPTR